tara:strand:- start:150 stop:452 length:303 start_codon:yes stop_codon:yes gene_type:complete
VLLGLCLRYIYGKRKIHFGKKDKKISEQKRPPQVTLKLFIAAAINRYTMTALDDGKPMFPIDAQKLLDDAIDDAFEAYEKHGTAAGLKPPYGLFKEKENA